MSAYFETRDLAVGYNGNVLIHDISVAVEKGRILTMIGPNGAGKSTILKTITKNIVMLRGSVEIGGSSVARWTEKEMARRVAVVLTERIRPELMTCAEVVAMGRYPYTDMLGRLTREDKRLVRESLERVHGLELADRDFMTLSDGQKQRVMLARAICQEPEVIILDEPTAYLDVRHKVELLGILREMAKEKEITVIMTLHEIDLAAKVSDYLMCVKGETIRAFGPPEEVLRDGSIEELYDMDKGSYNLLFGSVELEKPAGAPRVFVISGGGTGIPCFRSLQKKGVPFAAGILYENDVDTQVALSLGERVITAPAFEEMPESCYEAAAESLRECGCVLDAGMPSGPGNRLNRELLELARREGIPVRGPEEYFSEV